ncbi:MAG: hypothetical protein SF053_20265 [Bacteroidia bacterium]|nr:hypothetical protein [Bacteroidia bacterium]
MPPPFRIEAEFSRQDRVYTPGSAVGVTLTLKPSAAVMVGVTAGRYATRSDNPEAAHLHEVSADLAQACQLEAGKAAAFPLFFTAPDLPVHELRQLYWWVFVTVVLPEGEPVTEVYRFQVMSPADQIRQARSAGAPVDTSLRFKRWQDIAARLTGQLFFSVFTLGGGLAAFGAVFHPYWAENLPFAGMRWFAALVALGGLAVGRKIWEAEDPARHGRDATSVFFGSLYSLLAVICLYSWGLQPDFVLMSGHITPHPPTPLRHILTAAGQDNGYQLVSLVLGVCLFHLAGLAAAPRDTGSSPFFTHTLAVLAGLGVAASLSAGVAQPSELANPGLTAVGVICTGLFGYLCYRPDWANKNPRFLFMGLMPVVVLSLLAFQEPSGTSGAGLTGGLGLMAIGGIMAYIGNRNLLAALQVGTIQARLLQNPVSRGQSVEAEVTIVPRRGVTLASCSLEVSCWRSRRQTTDQETETWREWKQTTTHKSITLTAGAPWQTTLRVVLPIDAMPSATGSSGVWWDAYVLLRVEGKPDWSMACQVEVV